MTHHFCFSLCVLTRTTAPHLFCLVHENKNRGWWLPGGAMDDGETFVTAGLREAKEEAGADVVNPRLIRVEQTPNRIRYVMHGQVEDPATLKTKPDAESMGAQWFTFEDVKAIGRRALRSVPECFLRGSEPLEFFDYVERAGPTFAVDEFCSLRAEPGASRFDKRCAYATTLEARLIIPAGPPAAQRVVTAPGVVELPSSRLREGDLGAIASALANKYGTRVVGIALLFHHMHSNGMAEFGAVFVCAAKDKADSVADWRQCVDALDAMALSNAAKGKIMPLSCLAHAER